MGDGCEFETGVSGSDVLKAIAARLQREAFLHSDDWREEDAILGGILKNLDHDGPVARGAQVGRQLGSIKRPHWVAGLAFGKRPVDCGCERLNRSFAVVDGHAVGRVVVALETACECGVVGS